MNAHDIERTLRRMVLSGRTILCGGDRSFLPETVAMLATLARRAGRDADLVRIDFGGPPAMYSLGPMHRRPFLPDAAQWRGMPPTKGIYLWREGLPHDPAHPTPPWPPEWMSSGRRLVPPGGRQLAGPDAWMLLGEEGPFVDPRPEHDPGPAIAGGGIVVVDTSTPVGLRYLHWLAYAAIEAAEREGRPVPLLVDRRDRLKELAAILGWTDTVFPEVRIHHPRGDRTMLGRDYRDEARWHGAVSARAAGAVSTFADGVWSVRGDGRSVHAVRDGCGEAFDPKRPEREVILFAEVRPPGFLIAHRLLLERRIPDGEVGDLAHEAWLGGADAIAHEAAAGLPKPFRGFVGHVAGEAVPTRPLRSVLSRVAADLGPDTLAFLSAAGPHGYDQALQLWAGSGEGDGGVRRQFVRSHPALANLALDPEVTRLVDARVSPMPRLLSLTGAPRSALARFGVQRRPYFRMGNPKDWARCGAALAAVGHGRLPPQSADFHWYAFYDTLMLLALVEGGRKSVDQLDHAVLARLACRVPGRTWVERRSWLSRIGKAPLRDAGDMLRSLGPWLRAMAGGEIGGLDALALSESYGTVRRLLDASRLWHRQPLLRASRGDVPADATWPVPFRSIRLDDAGGHATAIGSMVDLEAEGLEGPDHRGNRGLAHCVAGYGAPCIDGECLIVSFRVGDPGTESFRRLSTLELGPDRRGRWLIAGRPFAEIQHKGLCNAAPAPEAVSLAETLRRMLAEGYPVDGGALEPRPGTAAFAQTGAPRDLLRLWSPILPPGLAGLDADVLAARLRTRQTGRNDPFR